MELPLDHAKKANRIDLFQYSTQLNGLAHGKMDSEKRRVRLDSQTHFDMSTMKDYPGTTKAPLASYLPPIGPRKLDLHSTSMKSDERFL